MREIDYNSATAFNSLDTINYLLMRMYPTDNIKEIRKLVSDEMLINNKRFIIEVEG